MSDDKVDDVGSASEGSTDGLIMVFQSRNAKGYKQELESLGIRNVVEAWDEESARPHLSHVEIVFGWNFPSQLLDKMPKLKWVQSSGAGVDTVTTSSHAFPKGVRLTRIVDQFSKPIAEFVIAYLLYVVKDIARLEEARLNRKWDPFVQPSLYGKTIGVAGLGSIGLEIVRKARAFDMTVHGLSRTGENRSAVDRHYGPDEWQSFVRDLDVFVLGLPLTPETERCVDASVLSAMKQDAILVNIGRGKLIHEDALVRVLNEGKLRAAILDVFEQEPLPALHPLWTTERVHISPHMSGPSQVDLTCQFFAENLKRFQTGIPLHGEVDLERRY